MPRIVGFEMFELDLPFRRAFRHAAAERTHSESLFLRCMADGGQVGYGEALPRRYVTGETRGGAFDLLEHEILPRLLGMSFGSLGDVRAFLAGCDGKAPAAWVGPEIRQSAAWCAVDLALLDTLGRAFGTPLAQGLSDPTAAGPRHASGQAPRYSLVLSDDPGARKLATLVEARLYGIRDVKVKADGHATSAVRLARRALGRRARIRLDSNMAWDYPEARRITGLLRANGVEAFEQPLAADDLDGMARLTAEGVPVIADESFHDAASLESLIAARACAGISVRIAKCGGVVAALARCRRARQAGLTVQIGCQVGETSQLSAAQLALVHSFEGTVSYLEGCYGERLLAVDPVRPRLQFGWGGRPPRPPAGPGFGTEVDMGVIERHRRRRACLGAPISEHAKEWS